MTNFPRFARLAKAAKAGNCPWTYHADPGSHRIETGHVQNGPSNKGRGQAEGWMRITCTEGSIARTEFGNGQDNYGKKEAWDQKLLQGRMQIDRLPEKRFHAMVSANSPETIHILIVEGPAGQWMGEMQDGETIRLSLKRGFWKKTQHIRFSLEGFRAAIREMKPHAVLGPYAR